MNKKGSKHMTYEQRVYIENALKLRMKCKEIAKNIGMDERTISKEIKKRRNTEENTKYGKGDFKKKDDEPCKTIEKFPFVCNGCQRKGYCFKKNKYTYSAKIAQKNYEIILSDSRAGLDITLNDKIALDNTLKNGIDKGQSINHIAETNNNIHYSKSSIYRLVNSNKTIVQKTSLRRAVKLKPRKHYIQKEDSKEIRIGRKYSDFLKYISANPFSIITEMDTVESAKYSPDNKCLLTLHITNTHFMMIFLLKSKSKDEVARVFKQLQSSLGMDLYKKIFGVVLTDRGSEFCDPSSIELDAITGEKVANLYYCNAYCSYQKGAIEENHTLIRYILPKGSSFDMLTQSKVDLIASHINSFYRDSIETTPYEATTAFFGESFIEKQKTRPVPANLVNLKPNLIK